MGSVIYKKDDFLKDFPFVMRRYNSRTMKQPLHKHDYIQIAYVLRGVCHHHLRGKALVVGKGDIFIISPGMEHSIHGIPDQEYEMVILDFLPPFVHAQLTDVSETLYRMLQNSDQSDSMSSLLQPWLHISQSKQPLVELLLQDIQDEFERRDEGFAFSIQINLIKLLILIDREYRQSNHKSEPPSAVANQNPIELSVRYVQEHFGQDIPLEAAAGIAKMTPSYFSHRFKKETGRSFIKFLHKVRIDRAMELIGRGEHTITQIALQVGFRQLSHFIRTFKKTTGLTPTEYKKSFRI
jgi:AraC-like DNA-binding protein